MSNGVDELIKEIREEVGEEPDGKSTEAAVLTSALFSTIQGVSTLLNRLKKLCKHVEDDTKNSILTLLENSLLVWPSLEGVYIIKNGKIKNKIKEIPEDDEELHAGMTAATVMALLDHLANE